MIDANERMGRGIDRCGKLFLGAIGTLGRWLRSPAAPWLLCLLLFGDVLLVASSEKVDGFLGGLRICWRRPSAVILQGDEGFVLADPGTGDEIGVAVLWRRGGRSGLWAPTTYISKTGVRVEDYGQTIPLAELDSLRGKFLDWLVAAGDLPPARGAMLRGQDIDESRALWFGYVHNAAAVALTAMLFWSLCAFSITKSKQLAGRNRDRDRCARCQYDLRGLPTGRCPECGEVFGA